MLIPTEFSLKNHLFPTNFFSDVFSCLNRCKAFQAVGGRLSRRRQSGREWGGWGGNSETNCYLNYKRPNEFFTNDRIKAPQTTEQNHHKRPKKHQKICLAFVTISVERQRQHEG